MDPDREKLIEDIYQHAVELPQDQRDRYLSEACTRDPALRDEVEALLYHGRAAPSRFLAGIPDELPQEAEGAALLDGMVGRKVGGYTLQRVIASGGMGTVYEAEQEQPRRTVALKLIRHGVASSASMRRFQYESEVLGHLNHPGIAQIFESGVHREPAGVVPYFAMEYLAQAVPVTEHVAAGSLSIKDRIRLFLKICDAVQYAHQRAVIHRDLKPANVLVTPDGRPKIIDFGVARILQGDVTAISTPTQTGQVVGTLRYMSPEQCGPTSGDVDARTDVYALGVVLFELLTGQLPYDLGSSSPFDAPRMIREASPIRPASIRPELSGDLEVILLKALEKEREQRYQSVAELARDLRHYLSSEPIDARRHNTVYVLRKAIRRHAVAAGLTTAFLLLVGGVTVALAVLYGQAEHQRQIAQDHLERALASEQSAKRAAAEAGAVSTFLNNMLSSVDPATARGRDVSVLREIVDNAAARVRTEFIEQPTVAASVADTIGIVYVRLGMFAEGEALLRDALAWRESALPADHPDVADSLNSLALLFKLRGNYAEAEPLYRRALDINLGAYGESHDVSIAAMNNLGALLKARGHLAQAEVYYRKALERSRALHGPQHADVARGLHNLAMLLRARRDYAGAIPLFEEAVAINRHAYGTDHPRLAISLGNLGETLADAGRPEEGAIHARQAVDIARRVFDPVHPDLGRLLFSLADVEKACGRPEAAEPLYLEAISIMSSSLGQDDSDVTKAKNNLALVVKARGELADAERLYREVLASRRRVFGDRHKSLVTPLFNLARLLQEQERFAEAEPVAVELVALSASLESRASDRAGDALTMLGWIRMGVGRWEDAEDPLRRALSTFEMLHGKDNLSATKARAHLGRCLFHLARLSEAERHLEAAFTELSNAAEPEKADASDVATLLARICEIQGRLDEATSWQRAAARAPTESTGGEKP